MANLAMASSIDNLSSQLDEFLTTRESKLSKLFSGRDSAEDVEYAVQDAVSKNDGSGVIDIHTGHESEAIEFDKALVTTEKSTNTSATVEDLSKFPAIFGTPAVVVNSAIRDLTSIVSDKLDLLLDTLKGFSGASAKTVETKAVDTSSVEKTKVNAFDIKDSNSIKKSVDAIVRIYPSIMKLSTIPISDKMAASIKSKSKAFGAVIECLGAIGKVLNENPQLNDKPILDNKNSKNIKDSIHSLRSIMVSTSIDLMAMGALPLKIAERASANVAVLTKLVKSVADFSKVSKKAEKINFNEKKLINTLLKPFKSLKKFNEEYKEKEYKSAARNAIKNAASLVPAILTFGVVSAIAGAVGLVALVATPGILGITAATYLLILSAKAFEKFGKEVKVKDVAKSLAAIAITSVAVLAVGGLLWTLGKMSNSIQAGFKTIPNLLKTMGLLTLLTFAFMGLGAIVTASSGMALGMVALGVALMAIVGVGVLAIGALLAQISKLDSDGSLKNAPKAIGNLAAGISAMTLVALECVSVGIVCAMASAFTLPIVLFAGELLLISKALVKVGADAAQAKKGLGDFSEALDGLKEARGKIDGVDFSALGTIAKQINRFVADLNVRGINRAAAAMKAMSSSMDAMSKSTESLSSSRMEVPTANIAPTSQVASNASTASESPKVIQEPVKQVMADQAAANTATAVNSFENTTAAKTSNEKKAEDLQISYKSEFERVISALESLSSALANTKRKDAPLDGISNEGS